MELTEIANDKLYVHCIDLFSWQNFKITVLWLAYNYTVS